MVQEVKDAQEANADARRRKEEGLAGSADDEPSSTSVYPVALNKVDYSF